MANYLVINESEVSYRNISDTDFDILIKEHPNTGLITSPFGINPKVLTEYLDGREVELRQKLRDFSTPDLVRIFINITNSKGELLVYMGSLTDEPTVHQLPVVEMNKKSAFRTFANQVAEVLNAYSEKYKYVEFYILGYSSFTEPLLEIASRSIYVNNNITTFVVPQGTTSTALMIISNLSRGIPKLCYITPSTFKLSISHSHNRAEYTAYIKEVNKELRKVLFDEFLTVKGEETEEEIQEVEEPQEVEEIIEEPQEVEEIPVAVFVEDSELDIVRKDLREMTELCERQSAELVTSAELLKDLQQLKDENSRLKLDSDRIDVIENAYDSALIELEELRTSNAQLERDLRDSEEIRTNITSAEIETLTSELLSAKELQPKYEVLLENNKMIAVKCDDLQVENVKLQAEVTEVLSEIKTIEAENEELKKQVVTLQTKLEERNTLEELTGKLDALTYLVNSIDNAVKEPRVVSSIEFRDSIGAPTLEELEDEIEEMTISIDEVEDDVVEELEIATQEEVVDEILDEELEIPEVTPELEDLSTEVDNPDDFLSGIDLEIESDSVLDDFFNNSGTLGGYMNAKLNN